MNAENNPIAHDNSRRKFIKRLAYIPPVVMTLSAVPSYATTGSPRQSKDDRYKKDVKHGKDVKYKKDVKHGHDDKYKKSDRKKS